MAESLIATMAGDFDPSAFTDDYREAMQRCWRPSSPAVRCSRCPRPPTPVAARWST